MQTKPDAKSRPQPIFLARSICSVHMSLMGRNMTVSMGQYRDDGRDKEDGHTHQIGQRVNGICIVQICCLSTGFTKR
jgi:hypothetical protein